eukprot:347322-Chlamydomonas_euryale.AAC.1
MTGPNHAAGRSANVGGTNGATTMLNVPGSIQGGNTNAGHVSASGGAATNAGLWNKGACV